MTIPVDRGFQNQTNPIEKPQTKLIQKKPEKTAFGLDVFRSLILLNRMVWFGLQFLFYQPNHKIRKTLIKYMSSRPILIETQCKLL